MKWRGVPTGWMVAAATLPAFLWLSPSLFQGQALSFRDQGDFFFPVKLYTADRMRAGEIPLWNPLSGMGEPWLANLQSGVFYPPGWLFLFFSPAPAAAFFLLLHFAIGAWGMRRFLKEEGVSDPGALFGMAVFCASGLTASLSAYWNHFGAWAYLPAIASLARSGLPRRSSVAALALLIALQAMGGSPEFSAATLLLAALLAAATLPPAREGWAKPPRWRPLRRAAASMLLGLALAGCVIVPFGELALRSDRRAPLEASEKAQGAVEKEAFAAALGISASGSGSPYLASLYVGPLAVAAAGAAFAERQRRRLALFLAAAGIVSAFATMAAFPGEWLREILPFTRIRYPAKALGVTLFCLAGLAGLGADALRFTAGPGRALPSTARTAVWGTVIAAALAAALLSPQAVGSRAATAAGLLALGLLAILPLERSGVLAPALQGLAAIALLASLFLVGRPLFDFVPEEEIRRRPESIAPLDRIAGRILTPPMGELSRHVLARGRSDREAIRGQREALLGYTNLLFGVPTVRTAAALSTEGARRITESIDREGPGRAAGAASARLIWTPFRPARLPSKKVGEFFRVPLAPYRPRLSFAHSFRVEPDPSRAWDQVATGRVDLTQEVMIGRRPALAFSSAPQKSILVARLAEDLPERVVAEVTSDSPGLLVLTDLNYPGWKAQVNGRPAEILDADGFFRAVALPAGSHRVVFRYRPLSFYAGAAMSVVALLVVGGLLAGGRGADDCP